MRRVFADAAYYIALLIPDDDLHARAVAAGSELDAVPQVTIDSVLVEVFAYMSGRGIAARAAAANLIERLRTSPQTTIIHQDAALFFAGIELYRARLDKGYSLTDCMSMIVCRQEAIDEVLTHDRHFQQEGFALVL